MVGAALTLVNADLLGLFHGAETPTRLEIQVNVTGD